MKVELDLSTEQLQELDKGLMNLLTSLNDEQKTQIVKEYLNNQMNNNFYKESSGYYSSSRQLTDFGKEVIDGLKDKVAQNITDDLLQNEELTKKIESTTDYVKKNIDEVIIESLVTHIVNNLFNSRNSIQSQIEMTVNSMLNNRFNGGR